MKITIENTTTDLDAFGGVSVSIQNKTDTMNITDVMEQIVFPALRAYGFSQATITDWLESRDRVCDETPGEPISYTYKEW